MCSKILFWNKAGEIFVTYSVKTNLENRPHISTESPKEGFNTVFQNFENELKHCNSDMWMELQLLVILDSTKLKIVWIKITTFFKRRASIILWSFSS